MSTRFRTREKQLNLLLTCLVKLKVCFMVLCISSQSYRNPLFGQTACAFQVTVKAKQERCRKKERHREKSARGVYKYTSLRPSWKVLDPWPCPLQGCDSQSARLRALVAEACARCTTPGHFSLFCSLWFWNKPSFRGTPWAPSGKVNSPGGKDAHYDQPTTERQYWPHDDWTVQVVWQTYHIPQHARLWILLQTSCHRIDWRLLCLETFPVQILLRTWHSDKGAGLIKVQCHLKPNWQQTLPSFCLTLA